MVNKIAYTLNFLSNFTAELLIVVVISLLSVLPGHSQDRQKLNVLFQNFLNFFLR